MKNINTRFEKFQINENDRYEDGYLPKIAYHFYKGNFDKWNYFMGRQIEKYGPLTSDDNKKIADLYNELVLKNNK